MAVPGSMAGATTVATSLATTPAKWPTALTGVIAAAGAGATPDLLSLPGFGAVPPKLIKRIVAKEFIDMWELLPETWQLETEATCCHSKRPRRALVTDIGVWTECYATMAAILSSAYPSKAPQFFAYLHTITKASRTFESAAWATYDMAFRRQAANRGNLDTNSWNSSFLLAPQHLHVLQPLDIGVLGPMKQCWCTVLKSSKISTRASNITKEHFPELMSELWKKSSETITSARWF